MSYETIEQHNINLIKESKMTTNATLDGAAVQDAVVIDTAVAPEPMVKTIEPLGVQAEQLRAQLKELQAQLDKICAPPPMTPGLKLDLGCGNGDRKRPGFIGVDFEQRPNKDGTPGVDVVHDLTVAPWPFEDESVEEVHASHMLEHIPANKRPVIFNELYRILKKGGKGTFITPHWASNRAYGDISHQWPPVSEMFWYYLDKKWRQENAIHLDSEYRPGATDAFSCDFRGTPWHYSLAQWTVGRTEEWKMEALARFKEAAQDMIATVTKL